MSVTIIDLHVPWIVCCVCGREDESRWGLATYDGILMADDYEGEWFGNGCCERCYRAWQAGILKAGMSFRQAKAAVEAEIGKGVTS